MRASDAIRAGAASQPDAVVVGSGPNGLAAAITLARAGLSVEVYEGADTPGGGCRTEELTLPGFAHDVCSAVHPLLAASPFFQDSARTRIALRKPLVACAHPLDGGEAAAVIGSVAQTAESLGADATAYRRLLGPLVKHATGIVESSLQPLLRLPADPLGMLRFGARGVLPMSTICARLQTTAARALFAGMGAHSMRPLRAPGTGAFGLLLQMLAHTVGWPVVEGGSVGVVRALLAELEAAGGVLRTGHWIEDLRELPTSRVTLLDVAPRQLIELGGAALPKSYRRALHRYRYGPGVCKVDWALSGPVPWQAQACGATATIHLGGTFEEITHSEREVAKGRHAEHPFCIAVQPSVIDSTRAPDGQQAFYAYCHVPSGSDLDVADQIEAQVERFAPGFRELVLARHTMTAADIEQHDPNYVGGDINCGAASLWQTVFRPTFGIRPYRTPRLGLYLCSSATPPGGGVHGMCGVGAARAALHDLEAHTPTM